VTWNKEIVEGSLGKISKIYKRGCPVILGRPEGQFV
jgi:hypothetical protein